MRGDWSTEAQELIDGGMTVQEIRAEISKRTWADKASDFDNLTNAEGARMDKLVRRIKAEEVKDAAAVEAAPATSEPLATEKQVGFILTLLARRVRAGEGGGFMTGPTSRDAIAAMTRREASAYITSLKGDY